MHLPPGAEQLASLRSQPDLLISIILEQARVIAELRAQVASLTGRVRELENQNHPPAAPFRRARPGDALPRGKPGRKPGHAPGWKKAPAHIDEHIEAPLQPVCPACSCALVAIQPLDQYIEDIIPARKHVTHLRTHQGYCPKCGQVAASTHPRQVSFAGGAAGTHLGARALGVACMLKHQMGLSFAKTCEALKELCGITITPGGLAQLFQRVSRTLQPDYETLHAQLLQSKSVHTDETSWYVGKPKPSLCVYCTPQVTYYRVVESKRRETLHETIPPDWPGVLVSDCLSVYDDATPIQQKCYAHHLKAIKQAIEQGADGQPGSYLDRCAQLLHSAMGMKKSREPRAPPQREEQVRIIKLAAQALLESALVDKPLEEAVRVRLWKQHDHLFTFLEKEGVEPTNNLAERQLRPAVIARKLSCGQRTWKGARAWEVLTSVGASAKQTAVSFIDLVATRCSFAAR